MEYNRTRFRAAAETIQKMVKAVQEVFQPLSEAHHFALVIRDSDRIYFSTPEPERSVLHRDKVIIDLSEGQVHMRGDSSPTVLSRVFTKMAVPHQLSIDEAGKSTLTIALFYASKHLTDAYAAGYNLSLERWRKRLNPTRGEDETPHL